MCYHTKTVKTTKFFETRFKATFLHPEAYQPQLYNAFEFPKTPVITNKNPGNIEMYHWGLIPAWAKDDAIRKNTLNAKLETIFEKPSFKNVTGQRCLVLVDGFFEWQWLDEKGKRKQKYEMTAPDNNSFAIAGLYNAWLNTQTGETINTYTLLTTAANEKMAIIHNSKKRMPVILDAQDEAYWLATGKLRHPALDVVATKVATGVLSLFDDE